MLAIRELKKAVHEALSGDAALTAQLGGIYDHAPVNAPLPFATITEASAKDWSTNTTRGVAVELVIAVHTDAHGTATALAAMERIWALLHEAEPALEGCTLVNLRIGEGRVERARDGKSYTGELRLSAKIQLPE